ncbi:hypothetical protein BpHYR1_003513 [Brachionus plicatilis]|uniref:Uncharacterized protein n=1 Tax=Brachionus plicatilis TaxID=10195 RepID=A0A3M7T4M5_BRAPC|nr:hypothetical protein BpHYR1_003513 [Brachionus plicatilis]
MTFLFFKI